MQDIRERWWNNDAVLFALWVIQATHAHCSNSRAEICAQSRHGNDSLSKNIAVDSQKKSIDHVLVCALWYTRGWIYRVKLYMCQVLCVCVWVCRFALSHNIPHWNVAHACQQHSQMDGHRIACLVDLQHTFTPFHPWRAAIKLHKYAGDFGVFCLAPGILVYRQVYFYLSRSVILVKAASSLITLGGFYNWILAFLIHQNQRKNWRASGKRD